MCKHEEKYCPRCKIAFECKAGSIVQCQCNTVHLTAEESFYLETKYEDCLCIKCIKELQQEYSLQIEKNL